MMTNTELEKLEKSLSSKEKTSRIRSIAFAFTLVAAVGLWGTFMSVNTGNDHGHQAEIQKLQAELEVSNKEKTELINIESELNSKIHKLQIENESLLKDKEDLNKQLDQYRRNPTFQQGPAIGSRINQ